MRNVLILFLLFVQSVAAQNGAENTAKNLERLDPHGKVSDDLRSIDINVRGECKTCHSVDSKTPKKIHTKEDTAERCTSCHNGYPHSGLEEHMGKSLEVARFKRLGITGSVSCNSCHRPHRAAMNSNESQAEKSLKKNSATHMMKRACDECHRWQ